MPQNVRPSRDNDPDNSGLLFNHLRKLYNLPTDQALARWLGVHWSALSKIRHGLYEVTPKLILLIYDQSDLSIEDIRRLIDAGAKSEQDPMTERRIKPRLPWQPTPRRR